MRYAIQITLVIFIFSTHSFGQCFEERHSTNWYDAWMSCEVAPNPNTARDESHWILYDLKGVFQLDRSHIWNYNDVDNLENGMREVAIDYSLDGVSWTSLGNYTFDEATGSSTYEGFAGPDFGGVEAAYILITGISNYGGTCYGLSEIRFEAEAVFVAVEEIETTPSCMEVHIYPNPLKTNARAYINSTCSNEEIRFDVLNLMGQSVLKGAFANESTDRQTVDLSKKHLPSGEYILVIYQGNHQAKKKFVVL